MKKLFCLLVAASCLILGNEHSRTVLILGDSIAAGYGLDPDEAFPALVQQKIDAAGLNYKVVNAGVSGDTTAGGLRRISWLLKQPIDLLLIELGGNDGLRGITPEETEKDLQGIIDKAKEKNSTVEIVVAGMQMPANMGPQYTQKYRESFGKIAKANHAALIPFLLEGVAARPELNQPDRIHPTAEGHKIIAETIWKIVLPLLKKQTTPAEAGHTRAQSK